MSHLPDTLVCLFIPLYTGKTDSQTSIHHALSYLASQHIQTREHVKCPFHQSSEKEIRHLKESEECCDQQNIQWPLLITLLTENMRHLYHTYYWLSTAKTRTFDACVLIKVSHFLKIYFLIFRCL